MGFSRGGIGCEHSWTQPERRAHAPKSGFGGTKPTGKTASPPFPNDDSSLFSAGDNE